MAVYTYDQIMAAAAKAAASGDQDAAMQLRSAAEKYAADTKAPEAQRGFMPQAERQIAKGFGGLSDMVNMINPISQLANLSSQLGGHSRPFSTISDLWTGNSPALGTGEDVIKLGMNKAQDALGLNTQVAEHDPTTIWEGAGAGAGFGATMLAPLGAGGKLVTEAGAGLKASAAAARTAAEELAARKFAAETAAHAASPVAQAAEKATAKAARSTASRESAQAAASAAAQAVTDAVNAGDIAAAKLASKAAASAAKRAATATAREAAAHTAADVAAVAAEDASPMLGTVGKSLSENLKNRAGGLLNFVGEVGKQGSTGLGGVATVLGSGESGGLSEWAKEEGGGPVSQAAIGMLGGLELPLTTTLAKAGYKALTGRAARAAAGALTGEGGKDAAQVVSQGVANRFAAGAESRGAELAAKVDRGPGLLGVTPAELTEDPILMGMAAHGRTPDDIAAQAARLETVPKQAAEMLPGRGPALHEGQKIVEKQLADEVAQREAAVAARHTADQPLLDAIAPKADQMTSSANTVALLNDAKKASKDAADTLWAKVNNATKVPIGDTKAFAHAVLSDQAANLNPIRLPKAMDRVLQIAQTKGLKALGVRQLNDVYSELQRAIRLESSSRAPNQEVLSTMTGAAKAINRDLDKLPNVGEGQRVFAARAATRDHYEKFGNGGLVEKALKPGKNKNPSALAISKLIQTGDKGAVAINQVLEAAIKGGQEAKVAAELTDHLKAKFNRAAMKKGTFDHTAAGNWMYANESQLNLMPQLKSELQAAVDAKTATNQFAADTKLSIHDLTHNSAGAAFVQKSPGKVVSSLVDDPNPGAAADDLLALVSKDKTGVAKAGVREAINRHLVAASGGANMTGEKLLNVMDSGSMPEVLSRFFTESEVAKMRQLGRELVMIQRSPANVHTLMNPPQSPLLDSAARIVGSKLPIPGVGRSLAATTAKIKAFKHLVAPNRNPQINAAVHETFKDPAQTAAALRSAASAGSQTSPSMGSGVQQGLGAALGALQQSKPKDVVSMLNPLLSTILGSTANSARVYGNQP